MKKNLGIFLFFLIFLGSPRCQAQLIEVQDNVPYIDQVFNVVLEFQKGTNYWRVMDRFVFRVGSDGFSNITVRFKDDETYIAMVKVMGPQLNGKYLLIRQDYSGDNRAGDAENKEFRISPGRTTPVVTRGISTYTIRGLRFKFTPKED